MILFPGVAALVRILTAVDRSTQNFRLLSIDHCKREILRILQLELLEILSTKENYLNGAEWVVFEFCSEKVAQSV